jgi:LysM repeat protein
VVGTLALSMALPSPAVAAPVSYYWAPGCTQWHTVQWGENLYRISLWYGTTVGTLQSLNGIYNAHHIYAGQTICVRGGGWGHHNFYYTVRWGDTLYSISRRYGVNLYTLMSYNHLPNPNWIYAGQVIYIP